MSEDLKPKTMKMPEIKDHIAHVYSSYAEALRGCKTFKRDNENEVIRSNKTDSVAIVFMKDTTLHYFMSEHSYYDWCKGRTYTVDGKKMHSGYELKGEHNE